MNAEQLVEWLEQHLPRHVAVVDLKSQDLQLSYVLNWGGFGNHSFRVTYGSQRYHLKITNDTDRLRRLQVWRNLHSILESRYRTPELIEWVDLSEIGFAGLLFRHVDGRTADFCQNRELVQELAKTADRLHRDAEIRCHLETSRAVQTYCDYFVETYIDRFTSDLEVIATDQPPFISSTLFGWMQNETDQLRDTANRMQAFQNPAIEAVHGDLHEGNVLVTPDEWFIVDWDDLSIGDPALEFAVLLWPMIYQGMPWRDFFASPPETGFSERMEVCLRAQLLDEVIDAVADYVEAREVPSRQAEVQLVKRRRHEEALRRYIASWGGV